MCQLETSTNHRNIPTRGVYRPDARHSKKGHTISRNRGNFVMPRTVGNDMASHINPQSSGWRPMRVCHYPKNGDMKSTQKRGTTAIRSQETDEKGTEKLRVNGKLCQIETRLHFIQVFEIITRNHII